jgi:hypothetical protein
MDREETQENEVLNFAAGDPRVPCSEGGATVEIARAKPTRYFGFIINRPLGSAWGFLRYSSR